jgi:hypothetical protein
MNFLKMTNRVRYTLGLEDITANDEVALAREYLNEGVIDILSRTRPHTRCINLSLSANVAAHDMSNAIIAIKDLFLPGRDTALPSLSREDVLLAQRSGSHGFSYDEPMLWISPIPSQITELKAYGVFRPSPMVGDTDDPALMTYGGLAPEFHPAIVNYALWKAGEYVQHEQSSGGERWRQIYEGEDGTGGDIARIKRILSKRVTMQGARRRDLTGNLGSLSHSGSYVGG